MSRKGVVKLLRNRALESYKEKCEDVRMYLEESLNIRYIRDYDIIDNVMIGNDGNIIADLSITGLSNFLKRTGLNTESDNFKSVVQKRRSKC